MIEIKSPCCNAETETMKAMHIKWTHCKACRKCVSQEPDEVEKYSQAVRRFENFMIDEDNFDPCYDRECENTTGEPCGRIDQDKLWKFIFNEKEKSYSDGIKAERNIIIKFLNGEVPSIVLRWINSYVTLRNLDKQHQVIFDELAHIVRDNILEALPTTQNEKT